MPIARRTDRQNDNNQAVAALENRGSQWHTEDVVTAIFIMLKETLPFKALQKVNCHLRRNCHKPCGMKIRSYANHLQCINAEELPNIPPRNPDDKLSDDELIDILLFGAPKSWQREMDRQGFDPVAEPHAQVVSFMELIEELEEPQPEPSNKKNNTPKKDNNKRKPSNNSEKKSDDSSGNKSD